MTNDEIKQALVELHRFCMYRSRCVKCPFANVSDSGKFYLCRLAGGPDDWVVGDWSEDNPNADD